MLRCGLNTPPRQAHAERIGSRWRSSAVRLARRAVSGSGSISSSSSDESSTRQGSTSSSSSLAPQFSHSIAQPTGLEHPARGKFGMFSAANSLPSSALHRPQDSASPSANASRTQRSVRKESRRSLLIRAAASIHFAACIGDAEVDAHASRQLFCHLLEYLVVEHQVRHGAFQPFVLPLQIPEPDPAFIFGETCSV